MVRLGVQQFQFVPFEPFELGKWLESTRVGLMMNIGYEKNENYLLIFILSRSNYWAFPSIMSYVLRNFQFSYPYSIVLDAIVCGVCTYLICIWMFSGNMNRCIDSPPCGLPYVPKRPKRHWLERSWIQINAIGLTLSATPCLNSLPHRWHLWTV